LINFETHKVKQPASAMQIFVGLLVGISIQMNLFYFIVQCVKIIVRCRPWHHFCAPVFVYFAVLVSRNMDHRPARLSFLAQGHPSEDFLPARSAPLSTLQARRF
jgi:hypothetical protein